jgi:hypothetical protein
MPDPTVSDGNFQPIDQIPSHSSPSPDGLVYVTCDRQPYRVVVDIYEGRRVRAAFTVSDDRDLWRVVPGADDVKVEEDHELAFVTSGGRFFTAPKFINGSDPTVSDGATFEEMVEAAAQRLYYRWALLEEPIRDDLRGRLHSILTAAGVPDLLVAHRAKEEADEANRALNRELLKLIEAKDAEIKRLVTVAWPAVLVLRSRHTCTCGQNGQGHLSRCPLLAFYNAFDEARAALEGSAPAVEANEDHENEYDCPTYRKFGACTCSTGVLGDSCPNTYVGPVTEADDG